MGGGWLPIGSRNRSNQERTRGRCRKPGDARGTHLRFEEGVGEREHVFVLPRRFGELPTGECERHEHVGP
jgi:hypothetical protein